MQYWLIKSEPSVYSWDQFVKDKKTVRDGVRNYLARNNLNTMKKWDLCFRYHSNEWKEIVGIAKVIKESYPDPASKDEKWDRVVVEVEPVEKLKNSVTLEYIKTDKKLANMALLKLQRLSVGPVTKEEREYICKLGGIKIS